MKFPELRSMINNYIFFKLLVYESGYEVEKLRRIIKTFEKDALEELGKEFLKLK